jgi:hypothetical protein
MGGDQRLAASSARVSLSGQQRNELCLRHVSWIQYCTQCNVDSKDSARLQLLVLQYTLIRIGVGSFQQKRNLSKLTLAICDFRIFESSQQLKPWLRRESSASFGSAE